MIVWRERDTGPVQPSMRSAPSTGRSGMFFSVTTFIASSSCWRCPSYPKFAVPVISLRPPPNEADNRPDRPGTRRCRLREDRQMVDGDDFELWCALNRLMAAYWADVDENSGLQAHEFYLPEGLFVIGNN